MKKIMISLCLVGLASWASANTNNVPMSVTHSFHKDYPDARATHWTMRDGKWDARFTRQDGSMSMTACYNMKGHRVDTRMPIAATAVPKKVMNHLNDKYPGRYEHSFTKIDRNNKMDLYAVKVKQGQRGTYQTMYLNRWGHEKSYASR